MKASEIVVGGWYEVNHNGIHRVGKCTAVASKPALYTFVTPDNEVIELTNGRYIMSACSAAPAQPTVEVEQPPVEVAVEAPVSDPVEPASEPTYTARPDNQPHDCGLSSEGREAEAEREASELAYREWLAAQPTVEPTPAPAGWAEVEAGVEVDPVELVETEAPVSGPSATIHVALEAEWAAVDALPDEAELTALQAEWARLETALAEAPVSPVVYTDDELSVYEARWIAALNDTPPADSPLHGPCEVVPEGKRELSDTPDVGPDFTIAACGDHYPPRYATNATNLVGEYRRSKARAIRPRWARAQARQRLLAGVR